MIFNNYQIVNEGELFAFVGPNGAGKTTTIDIIGSEPLQLDTLLTKNR